MFPAQALAEALIQRRWRVTLSTDARGARYAGGFPDAVAVRQISSATFARGGLLARLVVPLRILAGVGAAGISQLADRPRVVIGFGGYPSIPALGAAWLLRVPRMIHEQNAVPGRVNRLFARRVDRLACGTPLTGDAGGGNWVHVGNPVRDTVLARAAAPYAAAPGTQRVVVVGGSQGARVLSDVVPAALAALPEQMRARLQVAHQARPEDAARVAAAYRDAGIAAEVQGFFNDIPDRFAAAHLVISRAGASSIADLTVIGRPAVLVPYGAATGDHQTRNAQSMVRAGGAVLAPEKGLEPAALAEQIEAILSSPERAAQMAAAALSVGRPDATDRLVALVGDLTKTDMTPT